MNQVSEEGPSYTTFMKGFKTVLVDADNLAEYRLYEPYFIMKYMEDSDVKRIQFKQTSGIKLNSRNIDLYIMDEVTDNVKKFFRRMERGR